VRDQLAYSCYLLHDSDHVRGRTNRRTLSGEYKSSQITPNDRCLRRNAIDSIAAIFCLDNDVYYSSLSREVAYCSEFKSFCSNDRAYEADMPPARIQYRTDNVAQLPQHEVAYLRQLLVYSLSLTSLPLAVLISSRLNYANDEWQAQ